MTKNYQSMVEASLRTITDDIRKNQSTLNKGLEEKVDKYTNEGKSYDIFSVLSEF